MIPQPDIGVHIHTWGHTPTARYTCSCMKEEETGSCKRDSCTYFSLAAKDRAIKRDINAASRAIGPQLGCNPFLPFPRPPPPHNFRFFGQAALSLLRARFTKSTELSTLEVRSSMPSLRCNEIILLIARLLNTTNGAETL